MTEMVMFYTDKRLQSCNLFGEMGLKKEELSAIMGKNYPESTMKGVGICL